MATVGHVAVGAPVCRAQGHAIDVDQGKVLVIVTGQVRDVGSLARVEDVQRYRLVRPLVRGLGAGLGEGLVADVGDDDGQRGVEALLGLVRLGARS